MSKPTNLRVGWFAVSPALLFTLLFFVVPFAGMALMSLHKDSLDLETVARTRGCILKAREDWQMLEGNLPKLERVWNEKIGERERELETDFGYGNVTVR